jgi:hypothetical protein
MLMTRASESGISAGVSLENTVLFRASALLAVLLLSGCQRDGGVIGSTTLPNIQGKFVIEDDDRTTALTSVQHSIYYVTGSDRKLIFKGAGGSGPTLSLLSPDDILIRYCGGSIERVESQFFENEARWNRILRVQPVTSAGLAANGRPVC